MRRLNIALLSVLLALLAAAAQAQNFPAKPLKIIVPDAPGGPLDLLIRKTGEQAARKIGQPITVDDRGGAAAALQACAKSPPDGYTLCAASEDAMSYDPNLYPELPYDPDRDFTPVTQLVWVNGAVIAGGQVPYDSLQQMVEYARQHPRVVNFAALGGTASLFLEWVKRRAGVSIAAGSASVDDRAPAQNGLAQIIARLQSGEVDAAYTPSGPVLPLIQAGKLKALAVNGPTRSPRLAQVATLAEQKLDPGIRDWYGLFCPAGAPAIVVERLNGAFAGGVRSAALREFLSAQDDEPVGSGPGEFGRFLKTERANAKLVIEQAGMRSGEKP